MTYLLWSLPTLVVLVAIVSGKLKTTTASGLGLLVALPVAWRYGPLPLDLAQIEHALSRGLWIGSIISPYILGGLLFWKVAGKGPWSQRVSTSETATPATDLSCGATAMEKRRMAFFACFLVGPFAESVTGFGVGMVGTVMLLRRYQFKPQHLMVFALLSQTLIPWGAMGSGTLLAAAYARISPTHLAMYSAIPVALLMLVWLPLFWRTARVAHIDAPLSMCLAEAGWIAIALISLVGATALLGPETALLAAYGPLIVIRYLIDFRPTAAQRREALRMALPYAILVGGLALTRLIPELRGVLMQVGRLAPFDDLPAWAPLFHAGSWLVVGSVVIAFARQQVSELREEAKAAWSVGKHAVLTLLFFAMTAELLAGSGISGAIAEGIYRTMADQAVLVTPLLAGAFGILTNSGNAANSLFLPAQVSLAIQAGLSVVAVAALQQVSGSSMGLFSPVRMSMAAELSVGHGLERAVYKRLFPYAGTAFMLLLMVAVFVMQIRVSS